MKYVVILGDGMADYPVDAFDGKTIVQSDEDKGQEVCEKLRDEYGEDCIEMYGEFGPLIGTHVGRGAIAILVKIVTE